MVTETCSLYQKVKAVGAHNTHSNALNKCTSSESQKALKVHFNSLRLILGLELVKRDLTAHCVEMQGPIV